MNTIVPIRADARRVEKIMALPIAQQMPDQARHLARNTSMSVDEVAAFLPGHLKAAQQDAKAAGASASWGASVERVHGKSPDDRHDGPTQPPANEVAAKGGDWAASISRVHGDEHEGGDAA